MQIRNVKKKAGRLVDLSKKQRRRKTMSWRKNGFETLLIQNSITPFQVRAIHGAPLERVFILRCRKGTARLLCIRNPREMRKGGSGSEWAWLKGGERCARWAFYFILTSTSHQLKVNSSRRSIDKCRRMWTRRQFIVSTEELLWRL